VEGVRQGSASQVDQLVHVLFPWVLGLSLLINPNFLTINRIYMTMASISVSKLRKSQIETRLRFICVELQDHHEHPKVDRGISKQYIIWLYSTHILDRIMHVKPWKPSFAACGLRNLESNP